MQQGDMKLHGSQRSVIDFTPQQQAKSSSAADHSIAACGVVKAAMHGQTYKLPIHALQTQEILLLHRAWGTRSLPSGTSSRGGSRQ